MSFWDLESGEDSRETGTSYEVASANEPIPDGSSALATIKDAKWDEFNQAEYLKIQWSVAKPEQFAGKAVFQKLYLTDADPGLRGDQDKIGKKREKAKRMLAAIDANAGGKLARVNKKPTNEDLAMALINKSMVIRVQVYETDDGKTGNWIAAVMPKDHELKVGETKTKKAAPRKEDDWGASSTRSSRPALDDGDEIPF